MTSLSFSLPISSALLSIRFNSVHGLMRLQDPRQQGSGNAGATNMLRTAGAKAGLLVLAGDMLKGIVVIAIARWLHVNPIILGCMMVACVLGHVFPVFFRFRGGKGVATALAVFTATNPICGGICLLLWLGVASLSQYASLASIIAVCAAPLFFAWQETFGRSAIAHAVHCAFNYHQTSRQYSPLNQGVGK